MALVAKTQSASGTSWLGLFAATLTPLLYGLAYATPHGQLGDSLRVLLGSLADGPSALTEPAALLGRLCTLLPVGPLALRVALASAAACALGSRALYRSIDTLLRAQGVTHDSLVASVGLGLCLFVFGMPSLLLPALRPEAFALQTALALLFLSRLTLLEAAWPCYDLRPLYTAGVALGLCASADLRCSVLLLPAALPTLSRVLVAKGPGPLLRAGGLALLTGACVYVGFFSRHQLQAQSFDLTQLASFARNPGSATLIVLRGYGRELGLFGALVGLGAVAALQTPGVRRIGMIWVIACITPLLGYGALGHVLGPDDGLGLITYVLPASALLAAALFGALLAPDGRSKRHASRGQLGAVLGLLLVGVLHMQETAAQSQRANFTFLDTLSTVGRFRLPPRAWLLLREPANILPLLASEAEDHARPDLRIVPVVLKGHPQSAELLATRMPELKPLLRAYLLGGEFEPADLESLSATAPVLLDMQPSTAPALYSILRPRHLFYEVSTSAGRRAEERATNAAFQEDITLLHDEVRGYPEAYAAKQVIAMHSLAAAFYFADVGDRDGARLAVDEGRALCAALPLWAPLSAALAADTTRKTPELRVLVPEDGTDLRCWNH